MNITVLGYYYRKNLGDDLLMNAINILFKDSKYNIIYTNPDDKLNLTNMDIVILGGGEILNDYFIDKIIKTLDLLYTKPIIIALSTECSNNNYIKSKKIDFIDNFITRNKLEYLELVKRYDKNHVIHMPDLVFSLDFKKSIQYRKNNNIKRIGVCLARSIYFNNSDYLTYINCIKESLKILRNYNIKIYLFSFNTSNNLNESDILLNNDISIDTDYTIINDKVVEKLKEMNLLICSRFHSHVLSILYNIPFISICHTKKVFNLMNSINYEEYMLPIELKNNNLPVRFKSFDLINLFNNISNNYDTIVNKLSDISNKYKNKWNEFDINKYFKLRLSYPMYESDNIINNNIKEITKIIDNITDKDLKTQIILYKIVKDPYAKYYYGLNEKINNSNLNEEIKWIINDYNENAKIIKNTKIIKPLFNLSYIEQNKLEDYHRSGWSYVVKHLEQYDKGNILLDTYIDKTFGWGKKLYSSLNIIPYRKPWIGFIHHTPNEEYSINNTIALLKDDLFLESLNNCICIYVLSESLKKRFEYELYKLNIIVNVKSLVHPTEIPSIKFDYNKFLLNDNKKIIQIGAWLRNIYSIFALKVDLLNKAALIGKDMKNYYNIEDKPEEFNKICRDNTNKYNVYMNQYLIDKFNNNLYIKIDNKEVLRNEIITLVKYNQESVKFINELSNDEYDILLSDNIVFLHLIDVSACNTLIECIVRNTPIVINRLDGVIELLGKDYPLYYDNLEEINDILTLNNIHKAHNYLKHLDKKKYEIKYFIDDLVDDFEIHKGKLEKLMEFIGLW
jgi:polysaccharide pyruvyl transferase WcaK-like protein